MEDIVKLAIELKIDIPYHLTLTGIKYSKFIIPRNAKPDPIYITLNKIKKGNNKPIQYHLCH